MKGASGMPIKLMIVLALALIVFIALSSTIVKIPGKADNATSVAEQRLGISEQEFLALQNNLCESGIKGPLTEVVLSHRAGPDVGETDTKKNDITVTRRCPDLNGGTCIVYNLYRYQKMGATTGEDVGVFEFILSSDEDGTIFTESGTYVKDDWPWVDDLVHTKRVNANVALKGGADYTLFSGFTHEPEKTEFHRWNFTTNVQVCCTEGQKFISGSATSSGLLSGTCVDENLSCETVFSGPCPPGKVNNGCECVDPDGGSDGIEDGTVPIGGSCTEDADCEWSGPPFAIPTCSDGVCSN